MLPETDTTNSLNALSQWRDLASQLVALARRQAEAIAAGGDGGLLGQLLVEKRRVYEAAVAASRRASDLAHAPADAETERQATALRAEVNELLLEVQRLEERSRALLAAQMDALRAELETCRKGRRLAAYGSGRPSAPRFLDQRL